MVLTFSRETEARCEWLADTMRRAQRRLGFRRLEQMAGEMGMSRSTYCQRLANPGNLTLRELWTLESVLRHAGMTHEAETIRGGYASC